MARLEITDPSLVVLVGAAGAGKSTFATAHFGASEVLSSDALRGVVAGDEGDQRATRLAFAILHRTLGARLAAGRTTVVDATNVTPFARRGLLQRAAAAGVPAIGIVLDLPPELVQARNAARWGRTVPRAAVERQLQALRRSLAGSLLAEGFAQVVRLRTPDEVAALTIVRVSGRAPVGPRIA